MTLTSNYDNHLAGVGGDAKAGPANDNIIICKHESKLKHLQKIYVYAFKMKKTRIVTVGVFLLSNWSNASPHLFYVDSILVFGVLETSLKRLI